MTAAELERLAREQRRLLLTIARRRAYTDQDAEDAVQQALAIAFAHRERIRSQNALAYIGVVAQHEASRLRRQAERLWSLDEPLRANSPTSAHNVIGEDRTVDVDALSHARDALAAITP